MKIFDISPLISERTAVFPGDQVFRRKVSLDFKQGHHLGLSNIQTTVHIGAHVDAPNHYHPDGVGISDRSLDYYIGPAQVVTVQVPRGERIYPKDVRTMIMAPRVLFKTNSFPDPEKWNSDFNSLSPELIDWLSARKVCLVGIDTPSVDPEQSKSLESHQQIYKHNLAILEGIVLTKVPDGIYQLVALPLKIENADASPVRAVLMKQEDMKL